MAAGDLDAGVALATVQREVARRRGHLAAIDGGAPCRHDAAPHPLGQCHPRGPVVPADREDRGPPDALPGAGRAGAPDRGGEGRRQLPVHQAANVVLPEDVLGNVHQSLLALRAANARRRREDPRWTAPSYRRWRRPTRAPPREALRTPAPGQSPPRPRPPRSGATAPPRARRPSPAPACRSP